MECSEFQQDCLAAADGTLGAQERERLMAHVAACPECREYLAAEKARRARWQVALRSGAASVPDFAGRLLAVSTCSTHRRINYGQFFRRAAAALALLLTGFALALVTEEVFGLRPGTSAGQSEEDGGAGVAVSGGLIATNTQHSAQQDSASVTGTSTGAVDSAAAAANDGGQAMNLKSVIKNAGLAAVASAALLPQAVKGAERLWNGGGDGTSWGMAGNWDGGVPDAPDTAIFGSAGITLESVVTLGGGVYEAANLRMAYNIETPLTSVTLRDGTLNVASNLWCGVTEDNKQPTAELALDGVDFQLGDANTDGRGSLWVSRTGNTSSRGGTGVVSQVSGSFKAYVNEVLVAAVTRSDAATSYPLNGVLDCAASTDGVLDIRNRMSVGWGRFAGAVGMVEGTIDLGSGWAVKVGDKATDVRAQWDIAHERGGSPAKGTDGTFFQASGVFNAYCSDFVVGVAVGSSPCRGYLNLGATKAPTLDAMNLLLAHTPRNSGATPAITGRIDAISANYGTLTVATNLFVGYGNACQGELRLGRDWSVKIGSPEQPARLAVGGQFAGGTAAILASGLLEMSGGAFRAYCSSFSVGDTHSQSYQSRGEITLGESPALVEVVTGTMTVGSVQTSGTSSRETVGIVDFSASTQTVLSADQIWVGYGHRCDGLLKLSSGTGLAGKIQIGDSNSGYFNYGQGAVVLMNMALAVTNGFVLDVSGVVSNMAGAFSSGFALPENVTLENWKGKMSVAFTEAPQSRLNPRFGVSAGSSARHTNIHWGLCWAGNRVTEVNQLRQDGRLVVEDYLSGTFENKVAVFWDEVLDMTYLGFYINEYPERTQLLLY